MKFVFQHSRFVKAAAGAALAVVILLATSHEAGATIFRRNVQRIAVQRIVVRQEVQRVRVVQKVIQQPVVRQRIVRREIVVQPAIRQRVILAAPVQTYYAAPILVEQQTLKQAGGCVEFFSAY